MSDTNIVRPTMNEYRERLIAASAEGRFPSSHNQVCRYLGDKGRKCAIGIMLPDDVASKLDKSSEGFGTGISLPKVWDVTSPYLPAELTQDTAFHIQSAHDASAGAICDWPHEFFVDRINDIFKEAGYPAPTRPTLAAYKAKLLEASDNGKFPSMGTTGAGVCKYHGDDGKACAIGVVLPEKIALKLDSLDETGIDCDIVWREASPYLPVEINQTTAIELQNAHDDLSDEVSWNKEEFLLRIESIFKPLEGAANAAPLEKTDG